MIEQHQQQSTGKGTVHFLQLQFIFSSTVLVICTNHFQIHLFVHIVNYSSFLAGSALFSAFPGVNFLNKAWAILKAQKNCSREISGNA